LYAELGSRGWEILFAAKRKDVTEELLKAFSLPFVLFADNQKGMARKLMYLPVELIQFAAVLRKFRPTLIISNLSLHSSWIGWLGKIPHIAFIDTEERSLMDSVTAPFAQAKLTSASYYRELGQDHVRYPGNHELAYLHPKRFMPDFSVLNELRLLIDEPFVIIRLISWNAFHDAGQSRMSDADRVELVYSIAKKKRVFITAESELPTALDSFRFPLPAQRLHDALAFADLYIGEGITMASEAAVLGTPAVLLNGLRMGYCLEAEGKGMLFSFPALTAEARCKIDELLEMPDIRAAFAAKHQAFLAGKIDVTAFMTWFVETYPESLARLREDPGYAGRFV